MVALSRFRATGPSFADLVPYAGLVDNGVLLLKDGSLMSAWYFAGPDSESATDYERNELSRQINAILARLGSGWMIQVEAVRIPTADYPSEDRSAFPDAVSRAIDTERRAHFEAKTKALGDGFDLLNQLSLTPTEAARHGLSVNRDGRRRTAFELLSFPDIALNRLVPIWPELGKLEPRIAAQLEVDARYAAYLRRQDEDVAQLKRDEAISIPLDFDYSGIPSLSAEVRQKLVQHRPATIAQAGRIEGVTPAALLTLLARLKVGRARKSA